MTTQTMTKEQILPTVSQMDAAIDTIITKMYGGLEAASIEHFLQTGKVNGSFRERLYDCIKTTFMIVDIKQKTEHLKQLSAERERYDQLKAKYDALVMDNATLEYNAAEAEKHLPDVIKQFVDQERERAAKLVGALKSTILIFNKLGYPKTAEFVKQTIAEYDTQTKS